MRSLLPTLSQHPANVDLHRVAAVVLLRMLQEAPVARDMARSGGIQLMLAVLVDQARKKRRAIIMTTTTMRQPQAGRQALTWLCGGCWLAGPVRQLGDAETVAAVAYILYAISHPDVLNAHPPLDLLAPPSSSSTLPNAASSSSSSVSGGGSATQRPLDKMHIKALLQVGR